MLRKTFFAILFALCLVCAAANADVLLPLEVTEIDAEAFMNDTSITSLVLPGKVETIGSKAFYGCGLKMVYLPASVKSIAPNAFDGNGGMKVFAEPGSYAYGWAAGKGLIPDTPVGYIMNRSITAYTDTAEFYEYYLQLPEGYAAHGADLVDVQGSGTVADDTSFPAGVQWSGFYFQGGTIDPGTYDLELWVEDTDGNRTVLDSVPVTVIKGKDVTIDLQVSDRIVIDPDNPEMIEFSFTIENNDFSYADFYYCNEAYEYYNLLVNVEPGLDGQYYGYAEIDDFSWFPTMGTYTIYARIAAVNGTFIDREIRLVIGDPIGSFEWDVEASWLDSYTVTWTPIHGVEYCYIAMFYDENAEELYRYDIVDNTGIAYVNTDVGTKYYFSIIFEYDGESWYTVPYGVDPIPPVQAPENLTWTLLDSGIVRLSWDPIPGVTGYRLYYSGSPDWTPSTAFVSTWDPSWEFDAENPHYDLSVSADDVWYLWVCADNGDGPNYRADIIVDGNLIELAHTSGSFAEHEMTMSTSGKLLLFFDITTDLASLPYGIDLDDETILSRVYTNLLESPTTYFGSEVDWSVGEHVLKLWVTTSAGTKITIDTARLTVEQGEDVYAFGGPYSNEISLPLNGTADVGFAIYSTGCAVDFAAWYVYDENGSIVTGANLETASGYRMIDSFTVRGDAFPAVGDYDIHLFAFLENGEVREWITVAHVTEETVTNISLYAWLTDCYRISWTPVTGVSEYKVYSYQDEACTRLYWVDEVSTDYSNINTEPGVQHYIVIEWEQDGLLHRTDAYTVEPKPALPAPTNVSGSVSQDGTMLVTWNAVEGAEAYRICVSTNGNWGKDTHYETVYDSLSYTMNGMEAGVTYYVWVSANENDWWNTGYRSDRLSLVYTPDPVVLPTPVLSPAYLQSAVWNESDACIDVSWDPAEGAQGYTIWACSKWTNGAPDKTGAWTTVNVVGGSRTSAQIPLSKLTRGTYYYVTVVAYADGYENSPYSNRKLLVVPELVQEKEHYLDISRSSWKPGYKATSKTVTVDCDSEYIVSVSSDARSWLSYEIHGDQLTLTVTKNTTGSTRKGNVFIRCDEHARSDSISVSQESGIDLARPTITKFAVEGYNGKSYLIAEWTRVDYAEEYEYQFSPNGKDWNGIAKTLVRQYSNLYYDSMKYYFRVRASNGNSKSDWSDIKLMDNAYVGASDITINTSGPFYVGEEVTLRATISPSYATLKEVTWEITGGSDRAYILDGVLYPVKTGSITVRATTADREKKTTSKTFTIKTPESSYTPVRSITISGSNSLTEGDTCIFTKNVQPAGANQSVTWKVQNGTGTAYIDQNGKLVALTAGTVYVTAEANDPSGTPSNRVTVTISAAVIGADQVQITGVNSLVTGTQTTLTATVFPVTAGNRNVTWAIESGSNVISISPDGNTCVVTGITAGTAVVKATSSDGVVGRMEMTVVTSVTTPTAARVTDVKYGSTSIKDNKVSIPAGSRTFTVYTSDPVSTISVYLNGSLVENAVITDNGSNTYSVSNIWIESGINLISFRTSETSSGVSGELATYDSQSNQIKYIDAEGTKILGWPTDSTTEKVTLSVNDQVTVLGTMGSYLYVKYGSQKGWTEAYYVVDEHMHVYAATGEHENEKYDFYDQNYHYLSEYDEIVECSICGERGQSVHREIAKQDHGALLQHHWSSDVCKECKHDMYGYYRPVQLTLHMDTNQWLINQTYTLSITWEPSTLTANQLGIRWYVCQEQLINGNNQWVEITDNTKMQITGNNTAASCSFIPKKNGVFLICVTAEAFYETGCYDSIIVEQASLDEASYYQLLRSVPDGENPMFEEGIYNTIVDELQRCFNNDRDTAISLANTVRGAPRLYRDLYLWSFFDYVRQYDPGANISNHWVGRITVNTKNRCTWFHESGHAIDANLSLTNISQTPKYKLNLYTSIYSKIYQVVSTKVKEANTELGKHLSAGEMIEVVEAIMGPTNLFKLIVRGGICGCPEWGRNGEATLIGEYTDDQEDVFKKALELILTTYRKSDNDATMYNDMLAGCTNQVAYQGGHGVLSANNQAHYWFTPSGKPTYQQNVEAWAEYYSGQMTGEHMNAREFPEACSIMDQMAEELLQGYKNKHAPAQ
ncbi:MAG: Ig-like domain-containing protein [Clostridia bacterium]|nr:Ig-like domain-containing protein [Clostridia bacterium]